MAYGATDPMFQAVARPIREHPLMVGLPATEVDEFVAMVAEAAGDEAQRWVDASRTEAWW